MQLTEWYPPHTRPVRPGVYERQYDRWTTGFAWYEGGWGLYCETPEEAARWKTKLLSAGKLPWRGLKGPV
jgi:hypothetical protein